MKTSPLEHLAAGILKIRKIPVKDAGLFHQLRLKALKTDPEIFLATREEELLLQIGEVQRDLQNHYTLGAFLQQELVGMLKLMIQKPSKFRHIGILGSMYVEPGYRRLGIGKKLLGRMLKDIKNFPYLEALQLKVIPGNIVAIRLYESFGFECWAREKKALKFKDKYFDQLHYQKWLE